MGPINGVGGVFIFSNRPAALADWYSRHLGIQFEQDGDFHAWYRVFYALDPVTPERRLDTTFSIIGSRVDFSRPVPINEPESMYGDQPYMVNLRTTNLESLIRNLKSMDVPILARSDESYGRFAWIRDADGNRVELYEPVPESPAGRD